MGSGVVAIVPWERPGATLGARLFPTAFATTRDAERFFGALPDGPVAPALRFAAAAELLAVGSVVLVAVPGMLVALDGLRASFLLHASTRAAVALGAAVSTLGFSALLVGAHAVHTLAMARAARRLGGAVSRSRALRFGLFACGWDLCSSPAGLVGAWLVEGPARAAGVVAASLGAPSRSTHAALRAIYGLDGARASRARRFGVAMAMAFATPLALVLVLVVAFIALRA
jgi:hypothetical protein